MKIIVIGGVAAGMSAASQAKRRRPDAEVVVLEKGAHVSYGACGMPYNIADPARSISDLVVITADRFRRERGIDLRTGSEAIAIDLARKVVRTRETLTGREYDLDYDALVIATGASPVRPPLPGINLSGVFVLRSLDDGKDIRDFLDARRPTRAVIVGGGYIGLEMSEALRQRGLAVTVLEREPQILPGWDGPVVKVAMEELGRHGVEVHSGVAVESIEREGESLAVLAQGRRHPADLVLVSVGVRPNVSLAREAGIAIGPTGAIAVDDHMRTSVDTVYAAGDCVESHHLVSGSPAYVPLGTTANKGGKVAGANAAGADERFPGIVGSAGFKLFDLEVARTGLTVTEAQRLGMEAVASTSSHKSRAHGYPDAKTITTVLTVERGGRLLGAQMIGGDAVAKRVDVFATALHAGFTVEQIENLDLSYAPPFSPVYDPILIAATVAGKALSDGGKTAR